MSIFGDVVDFGKYLDGKIGWKPPLKATMFPPEYSFSQALASATAKAKKAGNQGELNNAFAECGGLGPVEFQDCLARKLVELNYMKDPRDIPPPPSAKRGMLYLAGALIGGYLLFFRKR